MQLPSASKTPVDQQEWIDSFYRECGREISLAYTTLNQMKNWAIVAVGALLTALVSFEHGRDRSGNALPIFIGAVFTHLIVLRFFVRAILCYINLTRWNKLQHAILRHWSSPEINGLADLQKDIANHYFSWKATISRRQQILSNLKLGFGLLILVPFTIATWGAVALWAEPKAMAILSVAIMGTFIEIRDFLKSSFFDTPQAAARRKKGSESVFPLPSGGGDYVALWVLTLFLAVGIALFPSWLDLLGR